MCVTNLLNPLEYELSSHPLSSLSTKKQLALHFATWELPYPIELAK
jgi:hypothetical protein